MLTGVTGLLCRARCLRAISLAFWAIRKSGFGWLSRALPSWVFFTIFVKHMLKLAPRAVFPGLKSPPRASRQSLTKTFVGGHLRLRSAKRIRCPWPQFPVNLISWISFRRRLPQIAKLLIVPMPITRLRSQVPHHLTVFHQLCHLVRNSFRIHRSR